MNEATLAAWAKRFFPHLIDPYGVLAVCAIGLNRRV